MKVDVYRNLHNGMYSIKSREAGTRGLVIAHATRLWLSDVQFVVSQAGRNRVLREKKKYVHAVVRGTLLSFHGLTRNQSVDFTHYDENNLPVWKEMHPRYEWMMSEGDDFTYNPYRFSQFVDRDTEQNLHQAECAMLRMGSTKYLPSEGIYMGGAGRY